MAKISPTTILTSLWKIRSIEMEISSMTSICFLFLSINNLILLFHKGQIWLQTGHGDPMMVILIAKPWPYMCTIRPHSHVHTYLYTHTKHHLCLHGMHWFSVNLHAANLIHGYWDAARTCTCTDTAVKLGPVAVSVQPLCSILCGQRRPFARVYW